MKAIRILPVLAVWLSGCLYGQTATRVAPDCTSDWSFSASGASTALNNVPQIATGTSIGGCVFWKVEAEAYNTGSGTVTFQGAPSGATGAAPGTFGTFAALSGTTALGSNPASSFPSVYIAEGFYPWVRVNVTVSGGTLRGTIHGWRRPPGSTSSGGGGTTQVTNLRTCSDNTITLNRAAINLTTATTTQIVAASGSTSITICSISLGASSTSNIGLVYGTGSNCGTGTNAITGSNGGFQSVLAIALDQPLPLPASQAFCVSSSQAVTIGGYVTYTQQ